MNKEVDIGTAERAFEDTFISLGFPLPRGGLVLDGEVHRFVPEDSKKPDGAYCFFPDGQSGDGWPHGWIKDWKTGVHHKWQFRHERGCVPYAAPSPAEIAEREERKARREAEAAAKNVDALEKARAMFMGMPRADPDHPYIKKKNIHNWRGELRQNGDTLLAAYRRVSDAARPLGTIQRIAEDGSKKFARGVSIPRDAAYIIDGDAKNGRVFIAEGVATAESAAEALALGGGFRAVFAAGNCDRMRGVAEAARSVHEDAKIYVLADDDFKRALSPKSKGNPGLERANALLHSGIADGVLVPPFPRSLDDPDDPSNQLTDWNDFLLMAGTELTAAEIERQIDDAEKKLARTLGKGEGTASELGLPVIIEDKMQLRDAVDACLAALREANTRARDPLVYVSFLFGHSALARVIKDAEGRYFVSEIRLENIALLLSHAANFMKQKTVRGEVVLTPQKPSLALITSFVSMGEWPGLPQINGVSQVPIVRPDGSIHATPGFDRVTGVFYDEIDRVEIPDAPTREDARSALAALTDVLIDFPYADALDGDARYLATALGFMLATVLRDAGIWPFPMLVIDAPRQCNGKTLHAQVFSVIMTGEPAPPRSALKDQDEWRKHITSALAGDSPMILFDNVLDGVKINPASLSMLLTSHYYKDRELGVSRDLKFKSRSLLIMNGNNIQLGEDLLRRVIRIRLNDGKVAAGTERVFEHPERNGTLLEYIKSSRGEILSHIFTVIRAWHIAGCPKFSGPVLPSFEKFSCTIGGMLEYAGLGTFLRGALEERAEMSDGDEAQWGEFLGAILSAFGSEAFTSNQLMAECRENEALKAAIPERLGPPEDKAFALRSGRSLSARRERAYECEQGIVRIDAAGGKGHSKNAWRVTLVP